MSFLDDALDKIRRDLGDQAYLTSRGFTKRNMHRQFLSELEETQRAFPALCFVTSHRPSIRQARLRRVFVQVGVYTKERNIEEVVTFLTEFIDGYGAECANGTLIKGCFHESETTVPRYNEKLGAWESWFEFRMECG
jgi:hypothetical protein